MLDLNIRFVVEISFWLVPLTHKLYYFINKLFFTTISIIATQVLPTNVIYKDKHQLYKKFSSHDYLHDSCCHEYESVNKMTDKNTQAFKSFHNELKFKIKIIKGIRTSLRQEFLNEFCFRYNNKKDFWIEFIYLLKELIWLYYFIFLFLLWWEGTTLIPSLR